MNNRRDFIKSVAGITAGIIVSNIPSEVIPAPTILTKKDAATRIRFAVIGINHGHINSQIKAVIGGGGEFVSFYAKEENLAKSFAKRYPQVKRARSEEEILEDSTIQLVLSASIPIDRAPLGIRVMQHGKDFMVDKPGIISLKQLSEVRRVQRETKRIYSIMYGERLESKSTVKARELVAAGAIGRVVQTIGLGPHRMNIPSRPDWFFDKKYFGGIICDIASHQFDQFLYFTNAKKVTIVSSQVANFNYPQYPQFEDFGDALVRADGCTGYIRVDWFTPDGLKSWGDGRLTILGTEGYIEIRKTIDIEGRAGGNHLFLVDQKETKYIDCSQVELPYGRLLVDDVLNRTETAMSQEDCFYATELALLAQKQAKKI